MRRWTFAPAAERDLLDIFGYIAQYDVVAARRTIDALRADITRLAPYPYSAPAAPEMGRGVRKLSTRGYAIYFRIAPGAVVIGRVIDRRRDLRNLVL